jgi:hypothetical protein|eukprot:TRINITY_DN68771_c0_g1_i1.p1 TRINITY_DN68771_c0_g1~~TRINITY_DN68771_c0_g1_i1.p1  ORF type:complete len:268 (-),score=42.13 TRINITY_DN68771_c0_g1_i1:114-917(-)
MFRTGLACGVFSACFAPLEASTLLRHRGNELSTDSFVQPLKFDHKLRVCNAFPDMQSVDVFKASEKLTTAGAVPYNSCADFSSPLKAGDKLDFKIPDVTEGTFSVAELPNSNAVLLLVVHLHDQHSTAMSFESHVYGDTQNAQVVVIDTYSGKAKANPWIKDEANGNSSRSEELRFNSVVAVNPGKYDVALDDEGGVEKARSSLVALDRGTYVVLRTGAETQSGNGFRENLLVFPQSDPGLLHSSSVSVHASFAACLATATFLFGYA